MSTSFRTANRAKPLMHTVAYKGVPIFRGLALALDHAEEHGAKFVLFSADRRDSVLAKFNKEHGTNLHGQQFLVDAHKRDPANFAPANSPTTTSHCLFSDGNGAYRSRGRIIPAGGKLPWHMLGIDASDAGEGNDPSHLLAVLQHLGHHVTRPYALGSEAHHFIFTQSPVVVLEKWKVIPKKPR